MGQRTRPNANHFISQTYAALLGTSSWQDLLDGLSRTLPNGKATLFYHDSGSGSGAFALDSGFDERTRRDYNTYYSKKSPWMAKALVRPLDLGVCAEQMCPRDVLTRTEFFHDFMKPMDTMTAVGVTMLRDNGCNFMLSVMCADGPESKRKDIAWLLGELSPHLRHAFSFYRRAELGASSVQTAADAIGVGIITLGCDRRVRWINGEGERLLAGGDLITTGPSGIVAPTHPVVAAALEQAMHAAQNEGFGARATRSISRQRASHANVRMTTVVPAQSAVERYFAGPCVVLVFETPADARLPTEASLMAKFALTPGEASMAVALAEGRSLTEVANARRITRETARTVLKRIFAKTSVRRQTQLVSKLLNQ
ncbi:MAG: helix-turn-helix transcriptional regulator [Hyphomicrobiaceae bacterium]